MPVKVDAKHVLAALNEQGVAPAYLIASHTTGGNVDRTRPICPYPQVDRWNEVGNSAEASRFLPEIVSDQSVKHKR